MIESRCGIHCNECSFKANGDCNGCTEIDKPFWADRCAVKSCCEEKSQNHCGECDQFPCEQLNQFAYDEKQGDDGKRIDHCRIWAGTTNLKYDWMNQYLLSKPGVTRNLQRDWNWIRYCIGDKMFAALCMDWNNTPQYITLKLEPEESDFLRQQYEEIIPGYYMNKKHWNSILPDGNLSDELLKELLDKSYALVLKGFSKKKQQEITGN